MKTDVQLCLLLALRVVLTPGKWAFWTCASWDARLVTRIENLRAGPSRVAGGGKP